jgi:hypothetical protein
MTLHTSKKFIASAVVLVLSFASLAWLTTRTSEGAAAPAVAPLPGNERTLNAGVASASRVSDVSPNDSAATEQTRFDDGYRAGYRDAQADLAARAEGQSYEATSVRRAYYPRTRVVRVSTSRGVVRRGHSTRNMILRIAAPAAIGAGIGAIAGGKKGAGIGALLGGGGGAVYHLVKHGRR